MERDSDLDHFVYCSPVVPTHVEGIVTLVIFTLGLFVQGRQQEWTNRLDFLWKIQVTDSFISHLNRLA